MNKELPIHFVNRVKNDPFLGKELIDSLEKSPPTSVRLNPHKIKSELPIKSKIPWCENAYFLSERPSFVRDPLFHAGTYYPQEAGSMFLDFVLRNIQLPENPIILDLCAAPGGKSTLIATFLNNKGILLSNEVISARSNILKENMEKWGFTNTFISNNDPKDFEKLPNTFDCIVIDAPCSGEGMFRKDLNSRDEWSEENVNTCSARQKRIVLDAWDSLKENGYIIYSTCTFNEQENENNIQWIIEQTGAELIQLENQHWTIGRNNIGAYGLPSKLDTEGFFICVLQKKTNTSSKKKKSKSNKDIFKLKTIDDIITSYVNIEKVEIIGWREFLFAIPQNSFEIVSQLKEHLSIKKLGTEIGKIIHNKFVPHEALAMNINLVNKENVLTIELPLEQCISYLKGDTFAFDLPNKQGYYIITYQNQAIGWIKNLGNRFNNLFPNHWRIKNKNI